MTMYQLSRSLPLKSFFQPGVSLSLAAATAVWRGSGGRERQRQAKRIGNDFIAQTMARLWTGGLAVSSGKCCLRKDRKEPQSLAETLGLDLNSEEVRRAGGGVGEGVVRSDGGGLYPIGGGDPG